MIIKLIFLGDIYSENGLSESWLSDELKQTIAEQDLVSCNLEGPIANMSTPTKKVGPTLKQPSSVITQCVSAGIKIFNLANNHLMDQGIYGLQNTIKTISRAEANHVGAGYKPLIIKIKDLTIAYISGCEYEFGVTSSSESNKGVAWINDSEVDMAIIREKSKGYFVVVQSHAGEETSLPLPEWRARYHHFIDLGADIVIGHHPHSPQGWESYHHRMIYYSLGNFYFKHSVINSSKSGYLVSLSIKRDHSYATTVIPISTNHDVVGLFPKLIESLHINVEAISSPRYMLEADHQAISLWKKYYSKYFRRSISRNPVKILKHKDLNYLMILHNIRIESHRFTITRALTRLISKESIK